MQTLQSLQFNPKLISLLELASTYVKDGVVLKHRYYNSDPSSEDYKFHNLSANKEKIFLGDLIQLMKRKNVVIEQNGEINLVNFQPAIFKLLKDRPGFDQLKATRIYCGIEQELKNEMSEEEMQAYANNTEGHFVEFLYEYAIKLGYTPILVNEGSSLEEYLFVK